MKEDTRAAEWPTVEELAAEERALRWKHFDEDIAWSLGSALVATARDRELPVVVGIQCGRHRLFHAALRFSTPDNDAWLVRKSRVVERFHRSSLHVGQLCRDAGRTIEEMFLVPERKYAAHGGAFPITVHDVGVVGSVAVSGLPQLEDHRLVVEVLRTQLHLADG